MQLEGTAAGLQTEGCERGIPNERGCFSARCPSRCSSAQCRRSSASGFPHSRFCRMQGDTFGAVRDVMLQPKANRKQITGSLFLLGGWSVRTFCDTHTTLMLFFGSIGISNTLVPFTILSMLGVVTVFPVMRWTW